MTIAQRTGRRFPTAECMTRNHRHTFHTRPDPPADQRFASSTVVRTGSCESGGTMNTKLKLLPVLIGAAGFTWTGCVVPADYSVTTVTRNPGYYTRTLPPQHRVVTYSGTRYYVHDDVYYRPRGSGYVVVSDPHPHRHHDRGRTNRIIRELPNGYEVTTVRGTRYYRHNDVYYRPRSGGYVIVERPY